MSTAMTLSDRGDAVLVEEEGDVLRAYKCPAGIWTIGTGLTAASGVVKPKHGMVITQAESRKLRRLALARNYEPAVAKALPTGKQNVFDGAVLFHFNTGAIARASWVKLFLSGAAQKARLSFQSWNKGGGKVLPGLVKRRAREWGIIEFANYDGASPGRASSLSLFSEHIHDFQKLGYDTSKGPVTTIVAFQRDHGLTQDGLIGPATRAAILRALSAKANRDAAKGGAVAGGTAGAGADVATSSPHPVATAPEAITDPAILLWVLGGAAALVALILLGGWVWRHRGPLFGWLPEPLKDWFEDRGLVLGRRVRT
jgi:lysozyme